MCCAALNFCKSREKPLPSSSLALSATETSPEWQGGGMAAMGQTEGRPGERTLFGHPVG